MPIFSWQKKQVFTSFPFRHENKREKFKLCDIEIKINLDSILNFKLIFIHFWLYWAFIAVRGLSLVVVSRGYSLLWYLGFSLWWYLLLPNMSYRREGFCSFSTWAVFVLHGFSCSVACGIFPDQGSNTCPLHG